MQLEQRAAEWLGGELHRGEKLKAVAAASYPELVRGRSIWIVAIGGALLGTALEAAGVLPSPFGLIVSLVVAIGGWYLLLKRKPDTIERPAAPWPLVVVTNQRVLFVERGLFGGGGTVAYTRSRSELKRATLASQRRQASRVVLTFTDGPEVHIDLQRAAKVIKELGVREP